MWEQKGLRQHSFLWIPLELSYFFSLSLFWSHLLSSSKRLLSPLFLYPSISSAFYFSPIYLFFPKIEGAREGHSRWEKEKEGKEEEGKNTVRCKEPQTGGSAALCYQLYFAVLPPAVFTEANLLPTCSEGENCRISWSMSSNFTKYWVCGLYSTYCNQDMYLLL